ncbi:MAG: acyl-CoA desaturase [Saprospiraceae bacterium]|nr:acyl-CoA desaturase [Candidatus Brachybacter algidus]
MSSVHVFPKFPHVRKSLHNELRSRVQEYFEKNNIKQTGNRPLYLKAIILRSLFGLTVLHLFIFQPHWAIALTECVILGLLIAAIGFNVMHDGSHGSFSGRKNSNKLAAYTMSMLGASHYFWNIKHNLIHHTFTNVDGIDDDIEVGKLMRFAPTQEKFKAHRFQHIYFVGLYMLMYAYWVFGSDYKKYFKKRIGDFPLTDMTTKVHVRFWMVKIWHALVFCALPIYLFGFFPWLLGFLVMNIVAGFMLSIVFQLAHTVEHTDFPVADADTNKFQDEFAAHQIKTTANFGTKNKFVSWYVGGLNFQIEHHLFPKISHTHYPAISGIIKKVCDEYELKYIEYKTVASAVRAHVNFLKQMGTAG